MPGNYLISKVQIGTQLTKFSLSSMSMCLGRAHCLSFHLKTILTTDSYYRLLYLAILGKYVGAGGAADHELEVKTKYAFSSRSRSLYVSLTCTTSHRMPFSLSPSPSLMPHCTHIPVCWSKAYDWIKCFCTAETAFK